MIYQDRLETSLLQLFAMFTSSYAGVLSHVTVERRRKAARKEALCSANPSFAVSVLKFNLVEFPHVLTA